LFITFLEQLLGEATFTRVIPRPDVSAGEFAPLAVGSPGEQ